MPNTAGQSGQTYFDSPIFNGPTPHEGPRALAVNCPFTNEIAEFNIDLTLSQTQAYISVIQGVFVDNSDNADVVSITANGATNQTIDFPAGAQGYIPILATKPTSFNVASAGAVTVPLIFLNVSVPAIIWGESSGGGGGGSGVIEIVNPGSQPAIGAGQTTTASSDAAGNLMVTINAAQGGEGQDPYTGAITPIYAQDGGLQVFVVNGVTVVPAPNTTFFTSRAYESYETAQYALDSSGDPVQLYGLGSGVDSISIYCKTGGGTCYIGNSSGVSPTTGYPIPPGESFTLEGNVNGMYACSDTGCTIAVLTRGN